MAVTVLIPTPLQKFTENKAKDKAKIEIECGGGNISELINSLETDYPGIKKSLCDDQGEPRRFLNFYVNSEDIRFLEGTKTSLQDGDEVSIVPAVAGG
ncbi:MAG: MoaD/ThiS family protein [Okeania sp. SIO3B5]|uniref:MoaD/ThiS family protein n=1 Tax=Okeania sp. SIO3B5 TaxID=2607811 RepID=UPI001401040D|nr:MoaD/ThiS family protein [Okeania sp. SIO3B5]NEO57799.1 MoaD/ThiS family protein [Okeania sp. SIO3B5]